MLMYGPLMVGLNGFNLNFIEKKLVASPMISGVVLFQRNFQCQTQIKDLIANIQAIRKNAHLPPWLIAIDHEGGAVQRLRGETFTDLPSAQDVAESFNHDPDSGALLLKAIATVTAYELGNLGIDLCLGPVLDLEPPSKVERIKSRCYGSDPQLISHMMNQLITEIQDKGLTCVAKHFPGSSSSASDPHHLVSISQVSYEHLMQRDLLPYITLCKNPLLKAMMLSHLVYVKIDDKPIPISTKWIDTILRNQIGFNGAVLTDCLQMLGACLTGKNLKDKILNVIKNGCDLALVTQIEGGLYQELYASFQDEALGNLIHSPHSMIRQHRIKLLHKSYSQEYYEKQLLSDEYLCARETIAKIAQTHTMAKKSYFPVIKSTSFKKKLRQLQQSIYYKKLRELAKKLYLKKIASFAIRSYYHIKLIISKF